MWSAALVSSGCGSSASTSTNLTAPTSPRCQPSVTASASAYAADGGAGTLNVSVGRECTWAASSEAAWIVLASPREGQGDGAIRYTVEKNDVPVSRRGALVVSGARVELSQAGGACRYQVSSSSEPVGPDGGERAIDVRTHSACEWRAATTANWISVTPASGRGDAVVRIAVRPNEAAARTAELAIADERVVLTQLARSAPPAPAPLPPPPSSPAPTPPPAPAPAPTPAPAPAPAPTPAPAPAPAPPPPAPAPPPPAPAPPPPPPPAPTVQVSGVVLLVVGTCPSLNLLVGTQGVFTTSATAFTGGPCKDVEFGRNVSVEGRRMEDGRVQADKVQLGERGPERGEKVTMDGSVRDLSGSCPAVTFRVDGVTVFTNGETKFRGGSCRDLRNGESVEVTGRRQPDGRVHAETVEIDD